MTSPMISKPTFEHHYSGMGIGHTQPRLSWRFLTPEDNVQDWVQTSYEVEITNAGTGKSEVHRVDSDQSILVPWPGAALSSRDSATVRVRCRGTTGKARASVEGNLTLWSEAATVEVGLLEKSDWKACFITSSKRLGPDGPLQPLRFRKEFSIPLTQSIPSKARLYITSLEVFDAYINGKLVSDECLAPGWTSYNHRLTYRVYDVTSLIAPNGPNVICAEVGEGWYATRLGFNGGKRFCYGGEDVALLVQLEIESDSETTPFQVVSDDSWACTASAIKTSELYDGEVYDMRDERPGWYAPGFKAAEGLSTMVRTLAWPSVKLIAPDAPPVRVIETISPESVYKTKSGKIIIDFGQNLVGKVLVKSVQLSRGSQVRFKHAEVMERGELGERPLRFAKATDTVISSGEPLENWTPRFTFHGFRYVQVDGWPSDWGMPSEGDVVALSVNNLHKNVVWSMRGNFLSVPTDCPQRDERLGWTGDLQVFCPSASYLYDTVGMLSNWLEDVACEQLEEWRGGVPGIVCPDVLAPNWPIIPQAIWADVTVLAPNVLYQYSDDKELLERQFASMQAWLDQGIDRGADRLWSPDRWQLADWLDPAAPPDDPGAGRTDNTMVADAYLVHVTGVFARICGVLGKSDLAYKYTSDAARLKTLFQQKYITPYGNLMSNTQTGLALAIQFDLYPSRAQRLVAAKSLEILVRRARFNIATGFAGTPLILHALTAIGRPQIAWLYPVTMGATTVWERWDSLLPDGTINPGDMTSFNHYALGAVVDWLHGSVGGVSPYEPGWKVIKVRPLPGGNVTSAEVRFEGPYGLVACSWKLEEGGDFSMTLLVPPNSSAVVTLPSELKSAILDEQEPSRRVGSGVHRFQCVYKAVEWPPKALVAPNRSPPEDDIAC
ncbi:glycoside hydrolase [Lipomyces orientalis]|uniref:Glycoside hydrolase n=1 Tax=Lipomyces orientalis TaxID=1233043 RepID=A0ACC3TES3_9ASCO